MRIKINLEGDYNINDFFKCVANISKARNSIWNGFQEGISEVNLSENDELRELLLKEYDVKSDKVLN